MASSLNDIFLGRSVVNQSKYVYGTISTSTGVSLNIGTLTVLNSFGFTDPGAWDPNDLLQTDTDGTVIAVADGAGFLFNDGTGTPPLVFESINASYVDFGLTANRAVVTDGAGLLLSSTATSTDLTYGSTVTSNVQSQINVIDTDAATNAAAVTALLALIHWTLLDDEIQPTNAALDVVISNSATVDDVITTTSMNSNTSLVVVGTATFSSMFVVDTTKLFANGGAVGINTVTPAYTLHVAGAGTVSCTGAWFADDTVDVSTTLTAAGLLVDSTVLVVTSGSGRVGIGTAAPTVELDVNGTVSISTTLAVTALLETDSALLVNTNQLSWDGTYLELGTLSATTVGITVEDGSVLIDRSDAAATEAMLTTTAAQTANGFLLQQQGTTRLSLLTGSGDTSVTLTAIGKDALRIVLEDAGVMEHTINGTTVLSADTTASTVTGQIVVDGDISFGATLSITGRFEIDTTDHLVYVDTTNNRVGILTDTPTASLHVVGTTTFDGAVTAGSWVGGTTLTVTSTTVTSTIGTTVFVVQPSTSRVGINTATPGVTLDVVGSTSASLNLDVVGDVRCNGTFSLMSLLVIDSAAETVTSTAATTSCYNGDMTIIWTTDPSDPTISLVSTSGSALAVLLDCANTEFTDYGYRLHLTSASNWVMSSPTNIEWNVSNTSGDMEFVINSVVETSLTNTTTTVSQMTVTSGMTVTVSGNVVMSTSLTVDDGVAPTSLSVTSDGVGVGTTASASYQLEAIGAVDFQGSSITRIFRADSTTTNSVSFGVANTGGSNIGWLISGGSTVFEATAGIAMMVDYTNNRVGFGGTPTKGDAHLLGNMLVTGNNSRTYGGSFRMSDNANIAGLTGNRFSIGDVNGFDRIVMPAAGQFTFLTYTVLTVAGAVSGNGPIFQMVVNGVAAGATGEINATQVVAAGGINSLSALNVLPTATFAAGDSVWFEITTASTSGSFSGNTLECFYNFT